ncbi:MAG: phosphatase, partial [Gammaproteobacteria bacterium]
PVDFNNPLDEDFNKFVAALEQNKHKKIWVHCAANMRVSAFVFKYRRDVLGLSPKNIEVDLETIWVPNKTWGSFLEKNS